MTLEDVAKKLQESIDAIEKTLESFIKLHNSYKDLMENAKAIDIRGLNVPNLLPYAQQLNLQKQILLTLKFHVECNIDDNKKREDNKRDDYKKRDEKS